MRRSSDLLREANEEGRMYKIEGELEFNKETECFTLIGFVMR